MADKRMFSLQIVDSDAFLELPPSAQALYFHLGMRADDDGFLNNARTIAKIVGTGSKDLDILVEKRFIIAFEGGISVIKHWKVNNYIQKDRKRDTAYGEILQTLDVKENGSYTLRIQNVSKMDTQVSIDKISIDKSSIDIVQPVVERQPKIEESSFTDEGFIRFWDNYPKKVGRGNVEKWFKKRKPSKLLVDAMVKSIEQQKMSKQWQDVQYIPLPMTWLNQERWGDELPMSTESVKIVEEKKKVDLYSQIEELTRQESMRVSKEKHKQPLQEVSDEELDNMLGNLGGIVKSKGF
jgi:hypothetical protein